MTPREEIQAWLDSKERDFSAGFALFVRFSHNRALSLQFMRKGESMQSKLEYELEKIAERDNIKESAVLPIRPVLAPEPSSPKNDELVKSGKAIVKHEKKLSSGKINPEDLPDVLRAKFDENSEKHKLMRAVHEKMKLETNDEHRKNLRAELIALDDVISANWAAIDEFLKTGKVPGDKTTVDNRTPEEVEAYKEINAARSYLSRNVTGTEKLEGAKLEKRIAELKDRYAVLVKHNATVKPTTKEALVKLGIINENPGNE